MLLPQLIKEGARVVAYDPEGMTHAKALMPEVQYTQGAYDCMKDADALVILTEWDTFRALDLQRIKSTLKSPVVIDLRNIYRPDEMRALGFDYLSVGRP